MNTITPSVDNKNLAVMVENSDFMKGIKKW